MTQSVAHGFQSDHFFVTLVIMALESPLVESIHHICATFHFVGGHYLTRAASPRWSVIASVAADK
jgi:hypothetical protein